jgi:hypothetical protein
VEADPLAGDGVSPASGRPASYRDPIAFSFFILDLIASGRPASYRDPIAFSFFILDLIAFSFLFRGLIAFIFSVQGPLCKNFILNSDNPPNNI